MSKGSVIRSYALPMYYSKASFIIVQLEKKRRSVLAFVPEWQQSIDRGGNKRSCCTLFRLSYVTKINEDAAEREVGFRRETTKASLPPRRDHNLREDTRQLPQ